MHPANPASKASASLGQFLDGVRILDLSQYIPGPMATLLLADMGAEVIKVEPPQGDGMRALGPRDAAGRPTFYHALNAGKTVLQLNLKERAARAAFLELVVGADIVVEGFRPGVMARLGIDFPVLRSVNPRVILCSISGYGATSPHASRAGHDANYLAMMGVAHRNGEAAPRFYDPPLADGAGSLFAALAMVGALHGRARSGEGRHIDLALADCVMPLQMMQIADFGATGSVPRRADNYLNGGAAFYQVYALADGRHAVLGAVEPKFWQNFCAAAGRLDLVDRHDDPMPQESLRAEVAAIFAGLDTAEAKARFGESDCCFSMVNDLGEALGGDQVAERLLVRPGPDDDLQSLFPAWIDATPPAPRASMRIADTIPDWTPRSADPLPATRPPLKTGND